jgi:hypothetical protein
VKFRLREQQEGVQMASARKDYKATKFDVLIPYSMIVVGLCAAAFGIAVLGYQLILWLRDGAWTSFDLRLAWEGINGHPPAFKWLGVQRIVDGFLELPLSLGFFVFGIIVAVSGGNALDVVEKSLQSQKSGNL